MERETDNLCYLFLSVYMFYYYFYYCLFVYCLFTFFFATMVNKDYQMNKKTQKDGHGTELYVKW